MERGNHAIKNVNASVSHSYDASCVNVIVDYLYKNNVTEIFGVSGSGSSAFFAAAARGGKVKPMITKHEGGAGWMAYSYAQTGRKFGVCISTTGIASVNMMPAVTAAYANSVPMLVITGEVNMTNYGKGGFQEMSGMGSRIPDICEMMKPVAKMNVKLESSDDLEDILNKVHHALTTGRKGPVHIHIPINIQMGKTFNPLFFMEKEVDALDINYQEISTMLRVIRLAKAPLIILGRGCVESKVKAEEFLKKMKIPFCTTAQAKGLVSLDNDLDFKMVGMCGSVRAQEYIMSHCDLILAVGTSLNEFTSYRFAPWFLEGKKFLRVDIDKSQLKKDKTPDLSVNMDAGLFFTVAKNISEKGLPHEFSGCELFEYYKGISHKREVELIPHRESVVNPLDACKSIEKFAPEDSIYFGDAGNNAAWILHYLDLKEKQEFNIDINTGCLGSSIPSAIGAKRANPERTVISICGDGAFLMNGNEVATAAEYGIPSVWIVFNDGKFACAEQAEEIVLGLAVDTSFKYADIASIAKSYGADSVVVKKKKELVKILKNIRNISHPLVVDVKINDQALPNMFERKAAGGENVRKNK